MGAVSDKGGREHLSGKGHLSQGLSEVRVSGARASKNGGKDQSGECGPAGADRQGVRGVGQRGAQPCG